MKEPQYYEKVLINDNNNKDHFQSFSAENFTKYTKNNNNKYNTINNNGISSFEISLPTENVNAEFSDYYNKFKKFGITFYNIGNLYGFCYYKKKNILLFCADKKWYLHLIIYFIELIVYILANYFIFNKLEKWKQIIFHISSFTFFVFYSFTVFINPGIILKNQNKDKFGDFCNKCNIFYGNKKKVRHCNSCGVCVEKIDHHCGVLRKCIAKNNFYTFFLMIASFIGFYYFTTVNIIFYAIKYYTEIKKKDKKII